MAIVFKKVVVPVDFSSNTDLAVARAIGLIGGEKAVLYLVHVTRSGNGLTATLSQEMAAWVRRLGESYQHLQVETHIIRGISVERALIGFIRRLRPDLVVIGKKQGRSAWFFARGISPGKVAKRTNCPVLTVKPDQVEKRMKIIVIPISGQLSERKLEWGILLAKKYKAQIHLLAVKEEGAEERMHDVFLQAYHHLREGLRHPVAFSTSAQLNPAKAALSYAKSIKADLILVNPGMESRGGGFRWPWNGYEVAENNSGIQVLEVGI